MRNTLGIDIGINKDRKIDIQREGSRWIQKDRDRGVKRQIKKEEAIDRQVQKEMEGSKDNEIERG